MLLRDREIDRLKCECDFSLDARIGNVLSSAIWMRDRGGLSLFSETIGLISSGDRGVLFVMPK